MDFFIDGFSHVVSYACNVPVSLTWSNKRTYLNVLRLYDEVLEAKGKILKWKEMKLDEALFVRLIDKR